MYLGKLSPFPLNSEEGRVGYYPPGVLGKTRVCALSWRAGQGAGSWSADKPVLPVRAENSGGGRVGLSWNGGLPFPG